VSHHWLDFSVWTTPRISTGERFPFTSQLYALEKDAGLSPAAGNSGQHRGQGNHWGKHRGKHMADAGGLMQHKPRLAALLLAFSADAGSCVALYGLTTGWQPSSWQPSAFTAARLLEFRTRTEDVLLLLMARLLLFPLALLLSYRLGRHALGGGEEPKQPTPPPPRGLSRGLQSATQPLLSPVSSSSSRPADSMSSEMEAEIVRIRARAAEKAKKEADSQRKSSADVRRNVVFALLFVLVTAMSVATGVKCVGFAFGDAAGASERPERLSASWLAVLMASACVWANLEFVIIKGWVTAATKEQGFLIKGLHPHRLFYATQQQIACHWCDVCSTRIKVLHTPPSCCCSIVRILESSLLLTLQCTPPAKNEGYRCRTCDFDVCDVCFRKENKDTKENVVRGDKGVKLKEVPIEISAVTSLSNSQLLTLK